MKLEKGELSSIQLMFLVAGFIQGSLLTLNFVSDAARHDLWIVLIAAFTLSLPMALIYIALCLRFPNQNLIQINDIIFGPYLGKLISIQYILLFHMIVAANFWFVSDFFISYFFPETPTLVIMIMFAFVCAWAVRAGIEVIARMSFMLVMITALIALSTFLMLLKDMNLKNFLPIFELPMYDFIHGTNILLAIPFNEIFIFTMVIPYVNKLKQVKRSVLVGLTFGAITFLLVAIRNIGVLGPLDYIMASSSIEAVRLIDIAKIIDRLEILVAIALLVTIFIKVCVFYYATVLGVAELLKLRSYVPIVIPVGIIGISLAMANESSVQYNNTAINTYPIFSLPFYFMIPLLTLFVAKLRKLPKKSPK